MVSEVSLRLFVHQLFCCGSSFIFSSGEKAKALLFRCLITMQSEPHAYVNGKSLEKVITNVYMKIRTLWLIICEEV